jgi:uncharacterized protein
VSEPGAATFSPDDLQQLEALLAEPPYREKALTPDALQGMIHALAIGPDPFPRDEQWIAVALGDAPDAPFRHDDALLDLMRRFAEQTVSDVRAGRCEPLLYELRRGRLDYRTWCEGFLIGVNAAESDWFAYGEAEDFDDLLGPIELVAEALPREARERMTPDQWRKRVLEAEANLPATLERLRAFWTIVREPPPTVRRDGPKVGRNDPCPCGSGRKFKQCHGKE